MLTVSIKPAIGLSYTPSWYVELDCTALIDLLQPQAQNSLVGTIPDMSRMTDLVLLDLSSNQLQGPLPTHWASSVSLAYFSVQTNMLTGSIPVSNLAGRYLGVCSCSSSIHRFVLTQQLYLYQYQAHIIVLSLVWGLQTG